jgi:hypothetical protein
MLQWLMKWRRVKLKSSILTCLRIHAMCQAEIGVRCEMSRGWGMSIPV